MFGQELQDIVQETTLLEKGGYKEATSYYCYRLSQLIAPLFFDEAGKFQQIELKDLEESLPEGRIYQAEFKKFVIDKLSLLTKDKKIQTFLVRLTLPLASPWIEEMIRASLFLSPSKLNHRLVRVAVLAASLCPLRQNIGSCFATAPCIFIQNSQYELLIKDLFDLVTMGFLRKNGEEGELRVPASVILGKGDLLHFIQSKEHLSHHVGWIHALQELGCIPKGFSLDQAHQHLSLLLHGVRVESETHDKIFRELVERFGKKGLSSKEIAQEENKLSHFSQNLLMKMWEYTVASFVDGFSRYTKNHLIIALGLEQHEPLGLGRVIYDALQYELDAMNRRLEENAAEINALRDKISMSEKLLQKVDSDDKYRRLKADLEYSYQKESFLLHEREIDQSMAEKITQLYSLLCEQITLHLPLYFVEVYDPSLIEKNQSPFEDGAAGFRLVYKHGRADPSVWSVIDSPLEFKKILTEFFIALEHIVRPQLEGSSVELLLSVMQKIHTTLGEEEFYKAALTRILHFEERYPSGKKILTIWSYLSGGTLHSLLHGYYGLSKPPQEEKFNPENPRELCLNLIEWMKEAPYKVCEEMIQNPEQGFLFHSPRHVFLFQPGHPSFVKTWDNREFTYTYLRDRFVDSNKEFYHRIRLSRGEQEYLYRIAVQRGFVKNVSQKLFIEGASLRDFALEHLEGGSFFGDILFFNHLPLVSPLELQKVFSLKEIPQGSLVDVKTWIQTESLLGKINEREAIERAQKATLLPTLPFIFADSNWHQTKLAFVTSPLSGEMDLWRVSLSGLSGQPMIEWKEDFGNKKPPNTWGLLTKREEIFADLREIKTRR